MLFGRCAGHKGRVRWRLGGARALPIGRPIARPAHGPRRFSHRIRRGLRFESCSWGCFPGNRAPGYKQPETRENSGVRGRELFCEGRLQQLQGDWGQVARVG
jgi:hypothetical protein